MRILVTGGRNYTDRCTVWRMLGALNPETTIIHGGCSGADTLADEAARYYGMSIEVFAAEWDEHGKAAGPIRNQKMIDADPDLVIAFRGGRGTRDTLRRARDAGIPILAVDADVVTAAQLGF